MEDLKKAFSSLSTSSPSALTQSDIVAFSAPMYVRTSFSPNFICSRTDPRLGLNAFSYGSEIQIDDYRVAFIGH